MDRPSVMAQPNPSYLKIHRDEQLQAEQPAAESFPGFSAMQSAIEQLTGWQVAYQVVTQAGALSPSDSLNVLDIHNTVTGRLSLKQQKPMPEESQVLAKQFAEGLATTMTEMQRMRTCLWQKEAELATNIPFIARDEEAHLAERLEAVLSSSLDAVGGHSAALYLLDDSTSFLNLRSACNLPAERFLEPPRNLDNSLADLEALAGHAVVLEDTSLLPHWKCPESYPSAVCIPVSTSTMPLGTMWVFSDHQRDFDDRDKNLLEVIAGRIAAELEREILLQSENESRQLQQQLDIVATRQSHQLPNIKPLVDGWDLAAWTSQAESAGGDFHDWSILEGGRLAVTVGDAEGRQLDAAMTATSLASAVKSHSRYSHDAEQLIHRANHTLWTTSAGDRYASLAYAVIDPSIGSLDAAHVGNMLGLLVKRNGNAQLWGKTDLLGASPEIDVELANRVMAPSDTLVLLSSGVKTSLLKGIGPTAIEQLSEIIREHRELPSEKIIASIREHIEKAGCPVARDQTVLVVRRRPN
ncbi:MAG: PP2C family protein-serine/threonine phosphatase [Pirellulales bacterium]